MKLEALALALFVAGACTSFALAGDGNGKGQKANEASRAASQSTTTGTTSSETAAKGQAKQAGKKVTLCHKAGTSGRWVKVSVGKSAASAKLKHGDVAPDASGKCPAAASKTAPATTTDPTTTTATTATR